MRSYSYQLYSSRKFPPLATTLHMAADAGYTQVEGYGALFTDATDLGALKALLDAASVTMPTAHIALDVLRDRPERAIQIAQVLGIEAVFGPFLAEVDRPQTASGWIDFGEMLSDVAQPLQDAGLIVGWHNHAFEFEAVDGQLPMDLILSASDTLSIELDVAWCVKAGVDPAPWIEANRTRIAAAHIKDIAPAGDAADEDGWADVGHGTLDWTKLFAALGKTSCGWFIAEHDNPSDHRRFATRSIEAMRSMEKEAI